MRHKICYNIVNIVSKLSFAYQSVAPDLRIVLHLSDHTTKVNNFICLMKKKQKA